MDAYQFFGMMKFGAGMLLMVVAIICLRQKFKPAGYTFAALSLLIMSFGVVTFQLDASRGYEHPGNSNTVGGVCRPEHFTNI